MKITRDNLDPEIIKKLDIIDKLYGNLEGLNGSELLSYTDGQFKGRKINDLTLRQIGKLSDIHNLQDHLYIEKGTIKNSIQSNFNINNRASVSFRNQILNLKGYQLFETTNQIRLFRKEGDQLLILDRSGIFYNYNVPTKKIDFSLDIASRVKSLFAITRFLPYDILDFQIFRGGFLFSTSHNGVFFADIENNNLEAIFPEPWILQIKVIDNDTILLISKTGTFTIYNYEKRLKIETFNKLKNLHQIVKRVVVDENRIYILATNNITNATKGILHVFEKDLAGIGYNDITSSVYPGYDILNVLIINSCLCKDSFVIAGIRDKSVLLWKYKKDEINKKFEEIIFNKLDIDYVNFIKIENQSIYINYKDRLIVFDINGNIINNIKLDIDAIQDIIFESENKFYAISDTKLSLYSIPNYAKTEQEFTAQVYEGEATNNIEILIKSNTGDQLITLIDPESLEEIHPNFHMIYHNDSYIKITGRTITNLIMKIKVTEMTEIEGIVVNADRIFLK
jgi:hypothetical protein